MVLHLPPERRQGACTARLILHLTPALSRFRLGTWLCANSPPLIMVLSVFNCPLQANHTVKLRPVIRTRHMNIVTNGEWGCK
jgi:hypothetical protein